MQQRSAYFLHLISKSVNDHQNQHFRKMYAKTWLTLAKTSYTNLYLGIMPTDIWRHITCFQVYEIHIDIISNVLESNAFSLKDNWKCDLEITFDAQIKRQRSYFPASWKLKVSCGSIKRFLDKLDTMWIFHHSRHFLYFHRMEGDLPLLVSLCLLFYMTFSMSIYIISTFFSHN